jgi:hypothetical protein
MSGATGSGATGGEATGGEATRGGAGARLLGRPVSWREIAIATLVALVTLGLLSTFAWRRHTRERRGYEHSLQETLDKLVTAQEGFFYDSTRYAGTLAALPSIKPAPDVHVRIVVATPRSWWGSATDDRLKGRTCYVWVGSAPEVLPPETRAPQNETKPLCFAEAGAGR